MLGTRQWFSGLSSGRIPADAAPRASRETPRTLATPTAESRGLGVGLLSQLLVQKL